MSDIFELPGELTIYTAADTARALAAWLPQDGAPTGPHDAPLDVAGQAVQEVDGAGLQVLLALDHSCRAHGLSWRLRAPSERLRKACAQMGVLPALINTAEGAPA